MNPVHPCQGLSENAGIAKSTFSRKHSFRCSLLLLSALLTLQPQLSYAGKLEALADVFRDFRPGAAWNNSSINSTLSAARKAVPDLSPDQMKLVKEVSSQKTMLGKLGVAENTPLSGFGPHQIAAVEVLGDQRTRATMQTVARQWERVDDLHLYVHTHLKPGAGSGFSFGQLEDRTVSRIVRFSPNRDVGTARTMFNLMTLHLERSAKVQLCAKPLKVQDFLKADVGGKQSLTRYMSLDQTTTAYLKKHGISQKQFLALTADLESSLQKNAKARAGFVGRMALRLDMTLRRQMRASIARIRNRGNDAVTRDAYSAALGESESFSGARFSSGYATGDEQVEQRAGAGGADM